MPSIGSELKTYLKTKAAITTLIGSGTSARIYTQAPKQNATLPYIVYTVFLGSSEEHLGGITGMANNRIQLDCYGATEEAAYALAEAVRLAPLQMFRGTMGSTYVHCVTSSEGSRAGYDRPEKGTDSRRYWHSRDYSITYAEATS